MAVDSGYAQIRLPSVEIRKVHEECLATIGKVGNAQWENVVLGKAGRARWLGIRPLTRGMARNPVDHPNGGGQGKSKGGGGCQHLASPWGVLSKGFRTRKKHKLSNRFIVVRRDGRPMKLK
jgi:large subunit ribosomal protein L2